jgi:outer membrane protein OmpA-like peptidoglycan-associated protein
VTGLSGSGPFTFSLTATNAYGTSEKVTLTIHLAPAACGTAGAPKCALKTITLGVVFFANNRISIARNAHATLAVAARKIAQNHVTRLVITATTDSVYRSSYNRVLSRRRAQSVERSLEAMLRSLHYRVSSIVIVAHGASTKYRGLAANRRATITGEYRLKSAN